MDGIHGSSVRMHVGEAQHALPAHYGHHMNNGNGMDDDDHDSGDGGGGGCEGVEEEPPSINLSDNRGAMVEHGGGVGSGGDNGDQLTLSFQGQVYVFDAVSPEKVQAVLLLLGGREVPPSIPAIPVTPHQNNRGLSSAPQRFSVPQRLASLIRFREKRKERNFDKKIRYTVRKEVALRMQRNKGQFTSSKSNNDDSVSAATSWGSSESWGHDVNGSQHQEIVCRHCGISEKSTPMMRRGPQGPRTLCNACGLMWANKGTLRDLSRVAPQAGHGSLNRDENGNFEANQMAVITGNVSDSLR